MKNGLYVSIISQNDEDTGINFISLCASLPGIDVVDGLPGNEILIRCSETGNRPAYSLNQIREALKRSARVDMFELATNPKSGEQYRTWYYLPSRNIKRKKSKRQAA